MEDKEKKISILYEKNKNHITAPISGLWGSVSPDMNYIIANFFLDQIPIPNYQTVNIDQNSGIADFNSPENISRGDLVREVFGTFTMSAGTARSIAKWLNEQADKLETGRERLDK